jgi:putative aldouronate transport system substrate-binding protein
MNTKKTVSLLLALVMALGILLPVAAAAETNKDDYWEIQIYSELANYAGLQTGWFAKILKDKFNVGFNIISSTEGGSDRFATQMISGNLGDLVFLSENNSQEHLKSAIAAGLILDMSANGLLDTYGQNIVTNYPLVLEKARVQLGDGTQVYALGGECVPTTQELDIDGGTDSWWGPYGRWDLYKELGYPEINDIEDLVPVLKAMHDLEPVNEDGEPVYAMSLWKDWDGSNMMAGSAFYAIFGWDASQYVFNHATEDITCELLQDNSIYLRTLKFYFDLNQLGLLDPDSITQTFSDVTTKEQTGRVLFNWFNPIKTNFNTQERLAEGKAMLLLTMTNQSNFGYTTKPYGYPRTVSIGANCKYPERAMEIINWVYSDEGMMEIYNGPEGVTWEYDANGVPVFTDLGWATYNDQMYEMPAEYGGGTFYEGSNKGIYTTPNKNYSLVSTGYPVNHDLWPSVLNKDMTPIVKDWSDYYGGALTSIQAMENTGKILKTVNQAVFITEPALVMDEMLLQKYNQISTVIVQYSWKMVFAADEAEFNALQAEMIQKAKGLGYDEVVAFDHLLVDQIYRARKVMLEQLGE